MRLLTLLSNMASIAQFLILGVWVYAPNEFDYNYNHYIDYSWNMILRQTSQQSR